MRRSHPFRVPSCLLLAMALPVPALAQPGSPDAAPATTTVAATDRARALHVEGARLFELGKYDQAYVAFVAAWALKKHPQIAGNLADCEVKIGRFRDAAEHYAFVVRDPTHEAKPASRQLAAERLKDVQTKIGTLAVSTSPTGAEVVLDGKVLGTSPLGDPIFVDPGAHVVEVRKDGAAASVTVDLGAGAAREVALTLKKDVQPPVEKRPLWPALASGGAAVVAFALGGGLAGVASARRSDGNALNAKLPPGAACAGTMAASVAMQCQAILNDGTAHDALDKGALGAFVAGGALALTTAGLTAWWATGPRTSTGPTTGLRVTPSLASGRAGVTVLGTW